METFYDGQNVIEHGTVEFVDGPGLDDPLMMYGTAACPLGGTDDRAYFVTFGGRLFSFQGPGGENCIENSSGQEYMAWSTWGSQSGAIRESYSFAPARNGDSNDETGAFFRNRYYDARLGRFTQEDPIGYAGGLNLYSYNGDDPASYTDPFGLCPFTGSDASCYQLLANWGASTGRDWAVNLGAGLEAFAAIGNAIEGVECHNGVCSASGPPVVPALGAGGGAVAGKITGFTKHGLEQAMGREGVGVSNESIIDAVRNPQRTIQQAKGAVTYVGENATVILNKAGEVITAWARNSAAWRIQP